MFAGKLVSWFAVLALSTALGCAQGNDGLGRAPAELPDAGAGAGNQNDLDRDGFDAENDCDDRDPTRNPVAQEKCDGVDQDCDGEIDEDAFDARSYYVDGDGDGFGDPATEVTACSAPAGMVDNGEDCYDDNPDARPGQTQFFAVDRGDGSFDYDCKSGEQSDVPVGNCSFTGSDCGFAEGWQGSAPACGTSGAVITSCLEVCIGICLCEAGTSTDTNHCR